MKGWWYYYLVAVAVKVPLTFWLLTAARLALMKQGQPEPQAKMQNTMLPLRLFSLHGHHGDWLIAKLWCALPSSTGAAGNCVDLGSWRAVSRTSRRGSLSWHDVWSRLAWLGTSFAVAGIHPYELTYFNALGGGPQGGRCILADSNLDWGQGLKSLARLQRDQPEFSDMTLYYFGDTEPAHYGVSGLSYVINAIDDQSRLSGLDSVKTRYLAVSASLQWGPWGPPGFFRILDRLEPLRFTDDTTIAIYRTADLKRLASSVEVSPAR